MSYKFLIKNILLVFVFVKFCTMLHVPTNYIAFSNGFLISTKRIYRYPFKINTPLYSKTNGTYCLNNGSISDSSNESNETPLENKENSKKSGKSDTFNESDSSHVDSTTEGGLDQESGPKLTEELDGTNFDEFHFNPETYKRIYDSFEMYKGPSYSLSEYNFELPEGCRTIVDFLGYPRNYDFARSADLSRGVGDTSMTDRFMQPEETQEEKRMEGPYLKSGYETMGGLSRSTERRFTTREEDEEPMKPEKMFEALKEKDPKDLSGVVKETKGSYIPMKDFQDLEDENTKKDEIPLSKINPNYFMFDQEGYLQYYIKYINQYKYDLFSFSNKDDEKPSFYLNHEYIQKIEKPFPPPRNHTKVVREYFLTLIPSLMDQLVEYIKNDPNKYNTPSPPMHDLTFLENFKPPEYLDDDYESDGERDYEKYASIKGLHDPKNNLVYPYFNKEPLLKRQLLSTYLEIFNTNELGPFPIYKKYSSRNKRLRKKTFPTLTKLPKSESEFGLNSEEEEITDDSDSVLVETRVKLFEQGKKKRGKAMVYLEPGNGNIIINNRDGYQYVFYNEFRLKEMLEPLSCLNINTKFNIVAKTMGGGISGQSVAIRHAVVRYLYRILSPKLKPILRKFDLVSIDRRKVERKKTNLRKARKKEKYSKR